MANSFEFEAKTRSSAGTASARALRRTNQVPAVIYGGKKKPVLLTLDHNKVIKKLENRAVYSHVLSIQVDGKEEKAVLKGLHRHPSKPIILHIDFQRVRKTHKIRVHVPLGFVGEDVSVGVKQGGILTHNIVDLEVSCMPDDLPETIEVDVSELNIGESVLLSELKLPKGVELLALTHGEKTDVPVVSIQTARIEIIEEEEGEVEAEGEAEGEGEAEREGEEGSE